jgi:hypothetical protein
MDFADGKRAAIFIHDEMAKHFGELDRYFNALNFLTENAINGFTVRFRCKDGLSVIFDQN